MVETPIAKPNDPSQQLVSEYRSDMYVGAHPPTPSAEQCLIAVLLEALDPYLRSGRPFKNSLRAMPSRRLHKSRRSCWRNPLVVFILTFLALGSLRFRHRRRQRRTITTSYTEIERGSTPRGVPFVKYQAIDSKTGKTLTVQQWANDIIQYQANAAVLNNILAAAPYDAFFWEVRPVDANQQPEMEFVVVDAPALFSFARSKADETAFARYLGTRQAAAAFDNLGGDARLIAPTNQQRETSPYSDLAAFCRGAPAKQIYSVWQQVAKEYLKRLESAKSAVWLSTCGLGVPWLHFRLDSVPKYYTYDPYTQP